MSLSVCLSLSLSLSRSLSRSLSLSLSLSLSFFLSCFLPFSFFLAFFLSLSLSLSLSSLSLSLSLSLSFFERSSQLGVGGQVWGLGFEAPRCLEVSRERPHTRIDGILVFGRNDPPPPPNPSKLGRVCHLFPDLTDAIFSGGPILPQLWNHVFERHPPPSTCLSAHRRPDKDGFRRLSLVRTSQKKLASGGGGGGGLEVYSYICIYMIYIYIHICICI